jgi:SAM-dependent methyltransferase
MNTLTSAWCPLCSSTDLVALERIESASLAAAWRRSYSINAGFTAPRIEYRLCRRCGLRSFDPPQDGDAALYEALQRHDWYYMADKPEYAIALRNLPSEGAVLEVGAGRAAFASLVGKSRYLGLEFNDAAIERAQRDGVALLKQPVQAHAQAHPGRYAAVVSFQVLEHVRDPAGFVTACVEALRSGGHLILAVPDHDGLCGLAQNNLLDMPPHHVSHWNERALRHIAEVHALEVVAIEREPVAAVHHRWLQHALMERRLRRWAGLRPRLLDTRLVARVIAKVASRLARFIDPNRNAPVSGHSILAAYRKRK